MLFHHMKYVTHGFIGGVAVTASVCYSLFKFSPDKDGNVLLNARENVVDQYAHRHPYGGPIDNRETIHYSGHTVYYDPSKKQPLWVSEFLTKDNIQGGASRYQSKFRRDDRLLSGISAENSDYWKSGWSRGHMAPAADFKHSQSAMDDTFYLTNIVPQDGDNNSGFWNRLEMHCRDLLHRYHQVHIVTGPVYRYNRVKGDKKFVEYEVIGKNAVPAPTHLYKLVVALRSDRDREPHIAAFVVPNEPIEREVNELAKFQVSIDELESLTGFTFHPELDRKRIANLCSEASCTLKNWKDLELQFVMKKIKRARSEEEISKIMVQLKKDQIKPTKEMLDLIATKLDELSPPPAGLQKIKTDKK